MSKIKMMAFSHIYIFIILTSDERSSALLMMPAPWWGQNNWTIAHLMHLFWFCVSIFFSHAKLISIFLRCFWPFMNPHQLSDEVIWKFDGEHKRWNETSKTLFSSWNRLVSFFFGFKRRWPFDLVRLALKMKINSRKM